MEERTSVEQMKFNTPIPAWLPHTRRLNRTADGAAHGVRVGNQIWSKSEQLRKRPCYVIFVQ